MWKNLADSPVFWYNVRSGKSRYFVFCRRLPRPGRGGRFE